jgi:hypothetical protein
MDYKFLHFFDNHESNLNLVYDTVDNIWRGNVYIPEVSVGPYNTLLTVLHNKLLKMGKNIFIKNNLDSLIRIKVNNKEKIDHTKGEKENKYSGNFKTSKCGINAKDGSDSLCGAVFVAFNDDLTVPSTVWEYENKKISNKEEDQKELMDEAFNRLLDVSKASMFL